MLYPVLRVDLDFSVGSGELGTWMILRTVVDIVEGWLAGYYFGVSGRGVGLGFLFGLINGCCGISCYRSIEELEGQADRPVIRDVGFVNQSICVWDTLVLREVLLAGTCALKIALLGGMVNAMDAGAVIGLGFYGAETLFLRHLMNSEFSVRNRELFTDNLRRLFFGALEENNPQPVRMP